MTTFIDFKKFRTRDCLLNALVYFCQRNANGKRAKYKCPWPNCPAAGNFSMKPIGVAPVAYCFGCHKTYDALEIVKLVAETSYPEAAAQLELYLPDA